MSLKSQLNQIIKDRKGEILTINELELLCKKMSYKLSNAERRLRPSESPNIERVMKKGYIIGYKYAESSSQENTIEQTEKVKVPSNPETRSEQMRPLWHDSGTISGPYISDWKVSQNGMDDH